MRGTFLRNGGGTDRALLVSRCCLAKSGVCRRLALKVSSFELRVGTDCWKMSTSLLSLLVSFDSLAKKFEFGDLRLDIIIVDSASFVAAAVASASAIS